MLGQDDKCIISVKLNIAFHAMLRLSMSVLFSCCNLRLRQSPPAPACVFAGATVLSSASAALPVLLLALTASLSGLGGLLLSPAPSPAVLVPPPPAPSRAEVELEVAKQLLCPACPETAPCESPFWPALPWAAAGAGAGLLLGLCAGSVFGALATLLVLWLRSFCGRHHGARPERSTLHPHLAIRGDQVRW